MVVLFAVLLRRKPGFLAEFLDKMAVGTEREEVPDVHGFILGIFQHLAGGVYLFFNMYRLSVSPVSVRNSFERYCTESPSSSAISLTISFSCR